MRAIDTIGGLLVCLFVCVCVAACFIAWQTAHYLSLVYIRSECTTLSGEMYKYLIILSRATTMMILESMIVAGITV